jgi:hypothetical protein
MTIEEKLYALLSPVSTPTIAQLYPITAPDLTATPYTVYFVVAQEPLETQQQALVTGLRCWDVQFSSYSESYGTARGETQKIIDFLTTYQDATFRVAFLKTRRTEWDEDTKLIHSMAEFHIMESLG